MSQRPSSLNALQVALALDEVYGPQIAAWRDGYLAEHPAPEAFVELCVDELHERQLCYSCGHRADRLVDDDFPWVCATCAER